jgi:hypothetical protein
MLKSIFKKNLIVNNGWTLKLGYILEKQSKIFIISCIIFTMIITVYNLLVVEFFL